MSVSHPLRNTFRAVLLGGLVLNHQGEAADTQKCAAPQPAVDSTYSSGQVWSYKALPSEGSSCDDTGAKHAECYTAFCICPTSTSAGKERHLGEREVVR
jgi:hypothetical protein